MKDSELDLARNEVLRLETRGIFAAECSGKTAGLGKRVKNKATGAFNSGSVVIVGNGGDKRSESARFRSALEDVVVPPLTVVERAGLDVALPKIYEAMLSMKGTSYIDSIGGEDAHNLPSIGVQLALKEEKPSVAFRVVFGATEEMPLRSISYLLPALLTMERVRAAGGELPQLQVILAQNISSRLNRLDLERVADQASKFSKTARAYVDEFFSDLCESVLFLEDAPMDVGGELREEVVSLARNHVHVSSASQEALIAKGNGSGRLNPYYAAAHLLMHDRDGASYLRPMEGEQPDFVAPSSIVSFGGAQERLFYDIRQEMKPKLGPEYNSVRTLQYFTRHHVPPYYMARGGDISLDDLIYREPGDSPIAVAAVYDLDFLRSVSEAKGDYQKFLRVQLRRVAV